MVRGIRLFAGCALTVLLSFTSLEARANFGFGVCCGPSACGIIPCDAGCAGAALNNMGTSVSNSARQADNAYDSLTKAIDQVEESTRKLERDIEKALVVQKDRTLTSFAASSFRIELANTQRSAALEKSMDHLIASLSTGMRESNIASESALINTTFGPNSQPIASEHLANGAAPFKELLVRNEQLTAGALEQFRKYLSGEIGGSSAESVSRFVYQDALIADQHTPFLLVDSNIPSSALSDVLDVLTMMVSPDYPDSTEAANDSLAQQQFKVKQQTTYSALLKLLQLKMGHGRDTLWSDNYNEIYSSGNAFSEHDFYAAEINGRLNDPEWWGSVMRLAKTGLRRELTIQEALGASMRYRIHDLQDASAQMDAIYFTSVIDKPNPEP